MTDNNLHEYLQSAYKPGHSTETGLVKVQNDILTSIDQHGIVILILLDLSAAFDTIDHDVLFSRMESTLGITGPALEWFRSPYSSSSDRWFILRITGNPMVCTTRISVGPSALPDLPPTLRNIDKKAWSRTPCLCGWYTTLYLYQTYQSACSGRRCS